MSSYEKLKFAYISDKRNKTYKRAVTKNLLSAKKEQKNKINFLIHILNHASIMNIYMIFSLHFERKFYTYSNFIASAYWYKFSLIGAIRKDRVR